MQTIALLILLLPALATSLAAEWETVKHQGQDYVTARSIKEFYGFKTMVKAGDTLELQNDVVTMKLTIGGQEAFLNNIKFIFSFKIVAHQDRYLVSRIDLSKIIDPVLRPTFIPNAKPVTTVIIDPAHGGKDSGVKNELGMEKNYTLAVARLLKTDLEAREFKVVMTRHDDRYLSHTERLKIANRFEDAIFISVHFNSGGRGRTQGIETLTVGNDQDSRNIALATAVHGTCRLKTGRPDRGIRRACFSALTGLKHPAVILEGGFLSHPEEARLINDTVYLKTLSRAMAEAVVKYRKATTRREPK